MEESLQVLHRGSQDEEVIQSGPTGSPDSDWHLPQRAQTVSWRSVDSERSFTNPLSEQPSLLPESSITAAAQSLDDLPPAVFGDHA